MPIGIPMGNGLYYTPIDETVCVEYSNEYKALNPKYTEWYKKYETK